MSCCALAYSAYTQCCSNADASAVAAALAACAAFSAASLDAQCCSGLYAADTHCSLLYLPSLLLLLQPVQLAQQLAGMGSAAEGEVEVSPYTHLERWTNATLSALQVAHECH
jgi:hypothetical protein